MEFFTELKKKIREAGLSRTHWITRTGCLGYCNDVGTTVAIHRRGAPSRFYTEVTAADFPAILSAARRLRVKRSRYLSVNSTRRDVSDVPAAQLG